MNELRTLKHENNAEIVKMKLKFQTENTFSRSLNTFLASRVSHTVTLILSLLKFEQRFEKRVLIRKLGNSSFLQTKEKALANSVLMLPLGFMLFVRLEQVLQETEKS